MAFPFHVTEHVIDGQHIREYPRATSTPNTPPKLCIKQYTPVTNPDPQPGDATIIATHGTGCPKELYEPLWQDLIAQTEKIGVRIRVIWMADAYNQGASASSTSICWEMTVTSWFDSSRDIIHMINHFNRQMPQPIIGIGHSAGAAQLAFASLFHPSLFTSLVFVEPYIGNGQNQNVELLLRMSTIKRDVWPSRAEAVEKARKIFKRWEPRVMQKWAEYGYRDLPTAIHPAHEKREKDAPPPVTLATTKHQETLLYGKINSNTTVQPGFNNRDAHGKPVELRAPHDGLAVYGMAGPDWHMSCRIEAWLCSQVVVHLRPPVLFLSGARSEQYRHGLHKELAEKIGTAFSGSGGMPLNQVRHYVLEGSHFIPHEEPGALAAVIAPWTQQELQLWQRDEERIASEWAGQSQSEKSTLPSEWISRAKPSKPSKPSKL